ncbi:MAG: response regulator transcription factor [Desulforhopalus sp.]
MKILIAEDDITSRLMLESIIKKWSFEVISVENGLEAWDILQQQVVPPIALLDWEMPGLDGLELCRRIKCLDREYSTYIILLTGRNSKEDIVTGLQAGANDYVTKPFDSSELLARINVAERLVKTQGTLKKKVEELERALEHVKALQGIIPICMHCHSIRNDDAAWHRLEAYIERHSDAQFSHSICPACINKYYPDYSDDDE